MDEKNINKVINDLNKKSKRSRLEGIIYIILILVICSSIVFSFMKYGGNNFITINTANHTVIDDINISQGKNHSTPLSEILSNAILRLGAVMLAIYLIQVLVGFVRYRFKVAEIHSSNANALILSGGDIEKFSKLSLVLLPNESFGKMPS